MNRAETKNWKVSASDEVSFCWPVPMTFLKHKPVGQYKFEAAVVWNGSTLHIDDTWLGEHAPESAHEHHEGAWLTLGMVLGVFAWVVGGFVSRVVYERR